MKKHLTRAVLDEMVMSGETAVDGFVFRDVSFDGEDLSNLDLDGCTFEGVSFRGLSLKGADLCGATFRNVDFTGATLTNAILNRASFFDCCFDGAVMLDADLGGASLVGCKFDQPATILQGVNLSNTAIDETTRMPEVKLKPGDAASWLGVRCLYLGEGRNEKEVVVLNGRGEIYHLHRWVLWTNLFPLGS